jgi:cytochrome P450
LLTFFLLPLYSFDFDAILNNDSEWVQVYEGIREAIVNPLFFVFPVLEMKFLWLFPKRQEQHRLLRKFHGMLDQVIENKRHTLLLQQQQGSEDLTDNADKDLLTLMLEGELSGEGILTDEELKGDLNIFFLGMYKGGGDAHSR